LKFSVPRGRPNDGFVLPLQGGAMKERTDQELPSIADEVLAKANAVIERLAADYLEHLRRDIAEMERHAAFMGAEVESRAAHYDEILRIAHDVCGQGAVFGFPLMTRYAGSLCRATRLLAAHDHAILAIVQAHLAAMRAMVDAGMTDLDQRTGLSVAAGLELLVSARADR
jgi:chemotaxis protein histidine kinase CheA